MSDEAPAATTPAQDPGTGGRSKRVRKSVELYKPAEVHKSAEKLVVKKGQGTKLGDIPNVVFNLNKIKGGDELLANFHHFLFKRKGKEEERANAIVRLSKWTNDGLHQLMDLLDVPRGTGAKDVKVEALIDFLEAPKQLSDKDLAAADAKKKEKRARKRKATAKPGRKPNLAAGKKRKAEDEQEEDDEEEDNEEEEDEAEEEKAEAYAAEEAEEAAADGEAAEAAEKPAAEGQEGAADEAEEEAGEEENPTGGKASAKRAEPGPKAKKERAPGDEPAPKKALAKKRAKKAEQAVKEVEDEGPAPMDEDAAPAAGSEPPSDQELQAAVLEQVKGADVGSFTPRMLISALEKKFGVSLKAKKKFISELAIAAVDKSAPEANGSAMMEPDPGTEVLATGEPAPPAGGAVAAPAAAEQGAGAPTEEKADIMEGVPAAVTAPAATEPAGEASVATAAREADAPPPPPLAPAAEPAEPAAEVAEVAAPIPEAAPV